MVAIHWLKILYTYYGNNINNKIITLLFVRSFYRFVPFICFFAIRCNIIPKINDWPNVVVYIYFLRLNLSTEVGDERIELKKIFFY